MVVTTTLKNKIKFYISIDNCRFYTIFFNRLHKRRYYEVALKYNTWFLANLARQANVSQ